MFSLESAHLAVSSSSKRMAQSSSRETNVNCLGSSDRTAALVDQKSGAQSRADRTLGVKCGMQVRKRIVSRALTSRTFFTV
jgi:hypothetical protein